MLDLFQEVQEEQLHETPHEDTLYKRPPDLGANILLALKVLFNNVIEVYSNVLLGQHSLYSKRVLLENLF